MSYVHGKVVCKNCGTVVAQCKCINHDKSITYVICKDCKGDKTK